jgi:hypothetical protein
MAIHFYVCEQFDCEHFQRNDHRGLVSIISWITVRTKIRGRGLLDVLAFAPTAVPGLVRAVIFVAIPCGSPGKLYSWFRLDYYAGDGNELDAVCNEDGGGEYGADPLSLKRLPMLPVRRGSKLSLGTCSLFFPAFLQLDLGSGSRIS